MNKMFFAFLAAIAILPGCFGLFKKEEPKIEQTSDCSAEEIAPLTEEKSSDDMDNAADEASDSDEK